MSKRKSKKLLEQASDAVEEIVPVVEQSLGSAYEVAKGALGEGREIAAHTLDEVTAETKRRLGRDKKKRRGKLRTTVLVAALLGIGAVVFKSLRGKKSDPAPWAASGSAPANTPAPATPAAATGAGAAMRHDVPPMPESPAVVADDLAGATPGEALSDARDETGGRPDTTPDDPAEVVDLPEQRDQK